MGKLGTLAVLAQAGAFVAHPAFAEEVPTAEPVPPLGAARVGS